MTVLAAALQAALAFDLLCTGHQTMSAERKDRFPFGTALPIQTTFRIDLETGRWCEGKCEWTSKIEAVTDRTITLEEIRFPGGRMDFLELNRETGQLTSKSGSPAFTIVRSAVCERKAFSQLPKMKF